MHVAIVGATGVIGRHVVPRLAEAGHSVLALGRAPEVPPGLLAVPGVTYARLDLLSESQVVAALDRSVDAVLHLATAIARPGMPTSWPVNDRIRREGTCHLVRACELHGITRYVQQSIAMLVPSNGDDWVDESCEVSTTPVTASAHDMEELVRASKLDWRIVRGGLLYGPGTGRESHWALLARQGRLHAGEAASRYASLVHVSDFAEALFAATMRELPGLVVNAVDDLPVRYGELFHAIRCAVGAVSPPTADAADAPVVASFRASNRRARETLGWRPLMRSYLSGLVPILAE
ncbi:NAD(P)-dependent oxidoreductase [Ideonella dechloratans]|uniref:NAD(P)-dependent oxidoreductase n=1 Tax=Ideonella dechloratans TaxID=36863 RepID=A0A643F902_IDEDE|nr:NAD(P)-dependent oxidoreductase [Ideonella dechloratans]KAB0573928.1 NAD(P)-dependent oxidoreductase [Ideonella dechloratans]UFU12006.1 NAD(P)-dependent oxidoreductase [Ideonella dechloratans]